ncbi:hypothetical protein, conserved, partial [Eimeria necatrix]
MAVIKNVIGGSGGSSVTTPILPEDGSTMQRTIDLTDWATVQRRLLERFDKTMSQSQLLTELGKVRWNGNPKEYTNQFAAVGERGVGIASDELAGFYCAGLSTNLHLLITNNGLVRYSSWEQAATAAARLYEPRQTVLGLRERASRAIRAATEANATHRKQENETRPAGNSGNCYECQSRGHPARVCPSKGERTKRPGETCKKCGSVGHYARDCPTDDRGRAEPENKSRPNAVPVSLERGNRLLNTVEENKMSYEDVQVIQPPSKTRLESVQAPMQYGEAPCVKTDSSGKSAEASDEDCRRLAIDTVPHSCNRGRALCCVGATAVLRVELTGSSCEALLDTGASRSFINPKTVQRLQLRMRRLPEEHRFTVATGEQLSIDRVVTGLTMWCGDTRFSRDFLVRRVPYDLVLGLDWLTENKVACYFLSDKLWTYVNGKWCKLSVVRKGRETLQGDSHIVAPPRTPVEQAYDILAKQVAEIFARYGMHLRNGRVIGATPQETSTMSVNKMPSGTPAHHRHATPKPIVAERPHGHKAAPPQ